MRFGLILVSGTARGDVELASSLAWDGERSDDTMQYFISEMSEATIDNVALYYSRLPAGIVRRSARRALAPARCEW